MINIRHIHSFNRVCVCCIEHSSVWVFVCALVVSMCIWKRPRFTNENDEWTGKAHDKYVEELPTTAQQKQHTHTEAMCLGIWRAAQIFRFSLSQPHLFITHSWGKSTELFLFKLSFSYSFSLPLFISFSNPVVLVVIHPFNPKIYTQTLYNI